MTPGNWVAAEKIVVDVLVVDNASVEYETAYSPTTQQMTAPQANTAVQKIAVVQKIAAVQQTQQIVVRELMMVAAE
jgi:aminopeptidase N